jgi:hypothetical protein
MSEPKTRLVDFPPCPFEDFLTHMNRSDSPEWTWTFIEMCARFGVFHSSPANTILARPVNSSIGEDDLLAFNDLDPDHPLAFTGLTNAHNTWHILYASGDPSFFFSLCPYELPFVSWHRNKGNRRIKQHDFQTIKKQFHGFIKTTPNEKA